MQAPAIDVWTLVADVRNTGRFSPETFDAEWLDGATGPAVGARFRGHVKRNEIGPTYWTTCRVTACEPGRTFGFEVLVGNPGRQQLALRVLAERRRDRCDRVILDSGSRNPAADVIPGISAQAKEHARHAHNTRTHQRCCRSLIGQESGTPACSFAITCSRLKLADFCRCGNSTSVLSMLGHVGLRRGEHEDAVEHPVVVGVRRDVGPLVGVGAQVEQLRTRAAPTYGSSQIRRVPGTRCSMKTIFQLSNRSAGQVAVVGDVEEVLARALVGCAGDVRPAGCARRGAP